MAVFQIGPESIMRADMVPFLFNSVVVPIALMIPVTGVAYVMLLNFGLVEFIQCIHAAGHEEIWKTPGEGAIDAVVSFSGGYALAVLLTNDLYKKGVQCKGVIIATGFSTVSISFLIVIANTLDLWSIGRCISCLLFCNLLRDCCYGQDLSHSRYSQCLLREKADSTMDYSEPLFKRAWHAGIRQARESKPLSHYLKEYYLGDAIKMSSAVTANILVIGLAGMLVAEYTPFFDAVGYLFYPVTWLFASA